MQKSIASTIDLPRFRFILPLLLALLGLVACTATYDWRTTRADDFAYEAMYPSKPNRSERSITIEGEKYVMSMEVAQAGNALFAVGTLSIDPALITPAKMIAQLKEGTLKSLKTDQVTVEDTHLKFTVAGQPKETVPAIGIKMHGEAPDGAPRILWVRWLSRIDRLGVTRVFQVAVLQTLDRPATDGAAKLLEEQYETFYAGFHPY